MKIKFFISNFLNQLTSRTGVDFVSIQKIAGWLFSAQIVGSASGLVLTVLLANLLSEADYGAYKYLMTLAGVVGVLSLSGIKTSATRAISKGFEAEIYRAANKILRWSGGMLLAAIAIASYYIYMGNTMLGYGALVIALAVPLDIAFSSFAAYLNGKQLYRPHAITGIVYTIIPVIATSVTVLFSNDPLFIFLTFMVSQSLTAIGMYFAVLYLFPPNNKITEGTTRYGAHLSFMNILGSTSLHFDKLITWHLLGPVQLAAYSVLTAPPQQLRYFNKIIATVALPRFSNRSIGMLRKTVWTKALILWLFASALIIFYWLVAPYIFEYLFPKYSEFVLHSQIFSLIMLFFPSILFDSALKAHEQIRALYILQTAMPILKLVLLIALVPFFALWGVIFSLLLNRLFAFLLNMYFFYQIKIESSIK